MIEQLLEQLTKLSKELADITGEVIKLKREQEVIKLINQETRALRHDAGIVHASDLRDGDRFTKLCGGIAHTKISTPSIIHFGVGGQLNTHKAARSEIVWGCNDNGHLCYIDGTRFVNKLPRRDGNAN
jgi:hypothetical protein